MKAGILYLHRERQQQRDKLYREFVNFWQELRNQGVWENLEQILQARLEPPNKVLDEQASTEKEENV